MTYQETIDYMFSQLPMFHRIGKSAYKANLDNTLALDSHFKHPHHHFKTVHIAGTNGKGSTSHMLASVLQEAGLKVGLYTSPHLRDFRERIRVNGVEISKDYVIRFVEENRTLFDGIQPSFFEMTVAMAFCYFADEKVDVAVVEVGLGGRLDSTNIIYPLVSVITNIGLDHTDLLGDTLPKIAREKAGIIKPRTPVVVGESHPETTPVFLEVAHQNESTIVFADRKYRTISSNLEGAGSQSFTIGDTSGNIVFSNLTLDLAGSYQAKNIATVLTAIDFLKLNYPELSEAVVRRGLSQASRRTGLKGRWYTLSEKPLAICDTGHNVDGITYIVNQLNATPHERLIWVFGMVSDKDITKVITLLPQDAYYIFTQARIPRAMDADKLADQCRVAGLHGEVVKSVDEAYQRAKKIAGDNDLIFIGGSTFVVAEVV